VKNKSLKFRLPDFFRQCIHGKDSSGNMPKLVKPESVWSGAESVIAGILRWADDGGKIIEINHSMID